MFQDLRYGMRALLKHRGFTCVAALTLALGIGANTAIFSLIDAVLLKMLPVNNPERLVLLGRARDGKTVTQFPYRAYRQIRDQNEVLSGLLAYHPLRLSVTVDNQPEPERELLFSQEEVVGQTSWERRPSLPACFGQSALAGNSQARMGGAPRKFAFPNSMRSLLSGRAGVNHGVADAIGASCDQSVGAKKTGGRDSGHPEF
jgi:hypothetical protein